MTKSPIISAMLFAFFLIPASMRAEGVFFDQKQPTSSVKKNDQLADQEPNLDGVVEVSFKIDTQGRVQIVNINSTSPQLSDYVLKKLSKIQLDQGGSDAGKVIKYRFVFKKQA